MVLADGLPLEMLGSVFASLPRADQRRTGLEYVAGLLHTPGRKSARNIANLIGGRGADQSLHHFINQSTWPWQPVRQALAEHLLRCLPVEAWVVRATLVPKVGQHSVGVHRRYFPDVGRVLNAQQALSVWAASGAGSGPVDWELRLPRSWLDDMLRRRRASIPDGTALETYAEQAARQCLALVREWGLPRRPVVLDARGTRPDILLDRLGRAGLPVLARIDASTPLMPADPALTGHHAFARMPAGEIMRASQGARSAVRWQDRGTPGGVRTGRLAVVAVGLCPGRAGGGAGPGGRGALTLMGLTEHGRPEPEQLWLTGLRGTHPTALLRLCALLDRVEYDYARISKSVGIEDYTGRSFRGWHRHMTLSSVAHAVSMLPLGI